MKKVISPDLQREIERSLAQEARKASQRLERLLQQRGVTRNAGKLESRICIAALQKTAIQKEWLRRVQFSSYNA